MKFKLKAINKKKEFLFVTLFFSILVFGVLIGFRTITSGFKLVDDQMLIRYVYNMEVQGRSVWSVIREELAFDFNERFRPLYYPTRVFLAFLFRDDFVALSILRGLETVFAFIVTYYVGRKLKCSIGYSLVFALVILMGPQSAIWWKLGPQELAGTWLIGLIMLCLLQWRENGKQIWNILGIVLVIVVSLYKESFAILIPAIMLFYVYTELADEKITFLSVVNAIRKNIWSLLALGIFLLFEAAMMVFWVGTDSTSYAGVDLSLGLWFYIKMFLNNFRLHLRLGQYAIWVLLIFCIYRNRWQTIQKYIWQLFYACVIVLPQFVIYAKCGIEERYVIPWIYGVAFFFIIVLCKDENLKDKRRKYYNIALGALIGVNFILTCYEADIFAYRGRNFQNVLDKVMEISDEDTKILAAFEPYGESGFTVTIWGEVVGRPHVYVDQNGECFDRWQIGAGEIVPFEEIDIVLMYDESHRHYQMAPVDPPYDFSDFTITEYGTLKMAVRN